MTVDIRKIDAPLNYSLRFDGSSSRVKIPTLTPLTDKFTVELQVKLNRLTGNKFLITSPSGAPSWFSWLVGRYATRLCFSINNAADAVRCVDFTTTAETGVWYHLCGVYDGTHIIAYFNGNFAAQTPQTGNIKPPTASPYLGNWGGNYFMGDVKTLRLYTRALTATEVHNNYLNNPTITGLELEYSFEQGEGKIVWDQSHKRRNGKLSTTCEYVIT